MTPRTNGVQWTRHPQSRVILKGRVILAPPPHGPLCNEWPCVLDLKYLQYAICRCPAGLTFDRDLSPRLPPHWGEGLRQLETTGSSAALGPPRPPLNWAGGPCRFLTAVAPLYDGGGPHCFGVGASAALGPPWPVPHWAGASGSLGR